MFSEHKQARNQIRRIKKLNIFVENTAKIAFPSTRSPSVPTAPIPHYENEKVCGSIGAAELRVSRRLSPKIAVGFNSRKDYQIDMNPDGVYQYSTLPGVLDTDGTNCGLHPRLPLFGAAGALATPWRLFIIFHSAPASRFSAGTLMGADSCITAPPCRVATCRDRPLPSAPAGRRFTPLIQNSTFQIQNSS